jgi:N6-adenosine-specific RNA methylase IME4
LSYRKLRMANDEERVNALAPIARRFRTLVIDPPWTYDLSLVGRAAPDYATMSHEELLALPVTGWAEDNCHLYLWTTNSFMTRAGELMAAWGFVHKTVLTWVKPRWGLGGYFRNSTEHVLFGVRGELRTRSDSIATHFEAPVGEHSEKPERFYEIVREASYGPYGEAFQRTPRPDFVNLYREAAAVVDDDFARDDLASETEGKNPIAESEDVGRSRGTSPWEARQVWSGQPGPRHTWTVIASATSAASNPSC